jgi:hypothetical protein
MTSAIPTKSWSGERVMARTFECQVVELHVRVALLINRFTQLGRPVTVPVTAMA